MRHSAKGAELAQVIPFALGHKPKSQKADDIICTRIFAFPVHPMCGCETQCKAMSTSKGSTAKTHNPRQYSVHHLMVPICLNFGITCDVIVRYSGWCPTTAHA